MNDPLEQTNRLNEILRNQNSNEQEDKEGYYSDEDEKELQQMIRQEKGNHFNGADDDDTY